MRWARRSRHPQRPLVAIVAGSKVSTKLTILRALAAKVDALIVGGGIANTFILAAGGNIGKSLAEPDLVGEAKAILDEFPGQGADPGRRRRREGILGDREGRHSRRSRTSSADDLILDIGPTSVAALKTIIARRGHDRLERSRRRVRVRRVRRRHEGHRARRSPPRHAFSIAGGGDTLAAIAKFGLAERIGYISTGGGAFLEFLEGKTLPAVAMLETRAAA